MTARGTANVIRSAVSGGALSVSDTGQVCGRVADLIDGLGEVYTREGVHIWLTGRHRLLDNRAPLDVMREDGGLERVEALLDQLRTGAYV